MLNNLPQMHLKLLIGVNREIPKGIYISPEKRQLIIDDLRLT